MTGQLSLFGIDMPGLLPAALLALLLARLLCRGLARLGAYRYIWHPALFDFALFMIVFGVNSTLLSRYGS